MSPRTPDERQVGAIVKAALAAAALAAMLPHASAQEGSEPPSWRVPGLGEAAELYFSPDGEWLVGTVKAAGEDAHSVHLVRVDGSELRRINDRGIDACSYFFPDGQRVVWTSTRDHPELPAGDYSDVTRYPRGAELYSSGLHGGDRRRLTDNEVYEAEVSVSPDGRWILFGRQIEGRMDLWRMRPDGSDETRVTDTPDWQEGGAFYLPDSETILYRAWRIEDQGGRGTPMSLFTIRHDGTALRRLTHDDGVNWSPHPAPDGRHAAFVKMLPPHNFEIFLLDLESGEQTRLTWNDAFDGFPAFSPDGRLLAFGSSRDAAPGQRQVFTHLMDVSAFDLGPRP